MEAIDVLNGLRREYEARKNDTYSTCTTNIAMMCLETANALERTMGELGREIDRANKAEKEIERLREVLRWIPVTERLPEDDGRYLCAMDRVAPEYLGGCDREVRIMRLTGAIWRIPRHIPNWINGEIMDKVTHWQPLPEPPKEG